MITASRREKRYARRALYVKRDKPPKISTWANFLITKSCQSMVLATPVGLFEKEKIISIHTRIGRIKYKAFVVLRKNVFFMAFSIIAS